MIDWDGLICPYCNGYAILDSITALEVSRRSVMHITKVWENVTRGVDKQKMLESVFMSRENKWREFFTSKYSINIEDVLAKNLFLQRTMKHLNQDYIGPKKTISQNILDQYELVIIEERNYHKLCSCLAKMLYSRKYNRDFTTEFELLEHFYIFLTEKHAKLVKDYKKYDVLSEEQDKEKIKKYKMEIDEIKKQYIEHHYFTTEETIIKSYDLICSMYVGLLQDSLYLRAFDLRPYKKIMDRPEQIFEFVQTFEGEKECTVAEFLSNARKIFKKDVKLLRKILLFEESNSNIYPCFVKVTDGNGDRVLIPKKSIIAVYYILHVVLEPDSFDGETDRRAKKFEQGINKLFKEHGFRCYGNYMANKMEIDCIAVKENYCFIIESKGKRLSTLSLETNIQEQMIRDMKGVVDGREFTTKDGVIIQKQIPSLTEKLEFVKQNYKEFGIQDFDKTIFGGVIVSMSYPWILEYKNVRLITDDDLKDCLLENKLTKLLCNT